MSAVSGDIRVIRVDLMVDGVDEDHEMDPGFFVDYNNDDDNGNSCPDYGDSPCPGEDDLVPLTITVTPNDAVGQVTLHSIAGGGRVKVWKSQTKEQGDLVTLPVTWSVAQIPAQMWLEGVGTSPNLRDIQLRADFAGEGVATFDDAMGTDPGLKIMKGDEEVTSKNLGEIVGRQVHLTAVVDAPGMAVTERQWTVPEERIANFVITPDQTHGEAVLLNANDLNGPTVQFYWLDGTLQGVDKRVEFSCQAGAEKLTAHVTFNVKRPQLTMTCHLDLAEINGPLGQWDYALRFGRPYLEGEKPGIRVDITDFQEPAGFQNGTRQFLQIYRWHRLMDFRTPPEGHTEMGWYHTVQNGLDSAFKYPDSDANWLEDTPSAGLVRGADHAEVDDSAATYYMYKPNAPDGQAIWVPLKKFGWAWGGNVKRVGLFTNDWAPDTENPPLPYPAAPVVQLGSDCSEEPSWNSIVVRNPNWVEGR